MEESAIGTWRPETHPSTSRSSSPIVMPSSSSNALSMAVEAAKLLPRRLKELSSWKAFATLCKTVGFTCVAFHCLSLCPDWALPACWMFASFSFMFLFEIGHDCANDSFFASSSLNEVVGNLCLFPLLQRTAIWRARPSASSPQSKSESSKSPLLSQEDAHPESSDLRKRKNTRPVQDPKTNAVEAAEDHTAASALPVEPDMSMSALLMTWSWSWKDKAWVWSRCMRESPLQWFLCAAAATAATIVAWSGGLWTLLKYWGVPLVIFNITMSKLVHAGRSGAKAHWWDWALDKRNSGSLKPAALSRGALQLYRQLALRSYLRFQLHVPSYHVADAMTAVKTMLNRNTLETTASVAGGMLAEPKSDLSSSGATEDSKVENTEVPDTQTTQEKEQEQRWRKQELRIAKTISDQQDTLHLDSFTRGLMVTLSRGFWLAEETLTLSFKTIFVIWLLLFLSQPVPNSTTVVHHTASGVAQVDSPSAPRYAVASSRLAMVLNNVDTQELSVSVPSWAMKLVDGSSESRMVTLSLRATRRAVLELMEEALVNSPNALYNLIVLGIVFALILSIVTHMRRSTRSAQPVYLLDFVTFKGPDKLEVPTDRFKAMQRQFPYDQESLEFMDKLIARTGLGEQTYFPPGTLSNPPDLSLPLARAEAEMVMFSCLDQLFETTGIRPKDVDIFIINCSLFNPTPSLTAMCVNKYKMREDVQSYNLAGMGCSAGVIAVHLAKDLLQAHPNSTAVVLSTENITMNWYKGNERGMLISNTLFRMGGAALALTNKHSDKSKCKYELMHTVRTHRGGDDDAYKAVYQDVDTEGLIGVRLSKSLMDVAGDALKRNITTLGPLILPWSEQLMYLWSLFRRKVLRSGQKIYIPNFKKAVTHFCIHAGGRAVVEAVEKALRLEERDVAASKATLRRYGNTSSSSIWYELAFLEKWGRMSSGDKVWQIAFGSGFKCNSAVWKAL